VHNPVNIKFDFLPPANNRNALSKEELDSFLRFLESKPRFATYLDMTIVLAETGMRVGEFAGLTINDIDFENNVINISKQLCGKSKKDLYIEKPKSKNGVRILPMNNKVKQAMTHLVARTQQCTEQRVIDGYSGFINIFERGSLRHGTAYDDIYRKLCASYQEAVGETIKVTPHVLRHTFCTQHAQNGMTIPSLQYLMGHASPTTTLKTYTHTNQNIAHTEFYSLHS
jgi:integrase